MRSKTYLVTGQQEIEAALAEMIQALQGNAYAARYVPNRYGGYSSTMEIIATLPEQAELTKRNHEIEIS